MPVLHTFDHVGGFVVGDAATGVTCYAYPTSTHANDAKRRPDKVAAEMIGKELSFRRSAPNMSGWLTGYDERNMATLRAKAGD